MINERLRVRLSKDRPNKPITVRIPIDAMRSLKAIATAKGMSGYRMLIKSYISEGLRRDEAKYDQHNPGRTDGST